jgi:beta-lactamase family protein
MRRLAAVALAGVLIAPATAAADEKWQPDITGAAKYADSRHGSITFAVRTDERLLGRGLDTQVPSASVFKAMLLVTYLRQAGGRELTGADKSLLAPMIQRSDNVAATRVRDIVGNRAIVRLARRAGMTRFAIAQVWGLSQITARDQTQFFLHIDALVPRAHRAYAMRLLRTITPSQRWGMGRVIPDGWRLYFKGGWGSGTGAVDHQVGLLRRGPYRVAVAILTVGDGTHAYGKATLKGVARRLFQGLERELVGTATQADGSLDETGRP